MSESDKLAKALADSLNSQEKGRKVAYFLNDEESPSEVKTWVSSGSTLLDMITSNRVDGGLPVGKICEIHGPEGSGKSLVAAHVLANTQEMGGVPVYIDTENAVNFDFLQTIGINPDDDFLYVSENRLERIFQIIETIITKVREKSKKGNDRFVTILVDSVAGATTENEVEGEYDKEGWNTDKAIVLSKAMRKLTNTFGREQVLLIFTNQIRSNIGGGMFGPKWTVPGGHAIPFHSSVRIRMRSTSKIREDTGTGKRVVGARLKPEIYKNRLAPPGRKCEFDLYFDSGIDDLGSIFDHLKNEKIIKHSGAGWYYMLERNEESGQYEDKYHLPGEEDPFKFRGTEWHNTLRDNPEFKAAVFSTISDVVLIDYETDWADRNNIEYIDNNSEELMDD